VVCKYSLGSLAYDFEYLDPTLASELIGSENGTSAFETSRNRCPVRHFFVNRMFSDHSSLLRVRGRAACNSPAVFVTITCRLLLVVGPQKLGGVVLDDDSIDREQ